MPSKSFVWMGIVMLVMVVGGCPDRRRAHSQVTTMNWLISIAEMIVLIELETGEKPPLTVPALVQWFERHRQVPRRSGVDSDANTVEDVWGHEIIVVSRSENFVALGSRGPNGEWENGRGDDIVVDLEECKERWLVSRRE